MIAFIVVGRPGKRGLFGAALSPASVGRVLSTVRMRFLSIGFLVATLLFCMWGNVVAAAFCPRLALANRSSGKQFAHQPASQAKTCGMEMGDMHMAGMDEPATDESTPDLQIGLPEESTMDSNVLDGLPGVCTHCSMHSQVASGPISIGVIHSEKKTAENGLPGSALGSLPLATVTSDRPTAHAPPGDLAPRYVLFTVFRI
jgi:hypothetical protein